MTLGLKRKAYIVVALMMLAVVASSMTLGFSYSAAERGRVFDARRLGADDTAADIDRLLERGLDRHQAAELERTGILAQAASRAKTEFLAKVSHEIRTPMNGVLGMTELLLGTALSSTQRQFATTIQRSANSLLRLINDILDFSKIEAGRVELERVVFTLRDAVNDVLELLRESAEGKGLRLTSEGPPTVTARSGATS